MRHIVALSGGAGSAWVAIWAVRQGLDPVLYFNDTKWEDQDLYRFNADLSAYLGIPITEDSDGRSPEDVFYDMRFLGNNRVPLCSRVLKAERLQKYAQQGDMLYFGIEPTEPHRAIRIKQIYESLGVSVRFPLIETGTDKSQIFADLESFGLRLPRMYAEGFSHNNCAGGCVRAGEAHWKITYRVRPDVFQQRMELEDTMREYLGGNPTILKGQTLRQLKARIDAQPEIDFGEPDAVECVGICNLEN
jgi:hypothetical protein